MAEAQTYTGSCHCGDVKFEVTGDMTHVISCNCSICSRTGALLAFVPVEQFKLLEGEGAQGDYQFNKHVIHHLFCKRCGIRSYSQGVGPGGAEMRAINVRCLEGIDLDKLEIKKVDGRSR
jgi:hypothetical protein